MNRTDCNAPQMQSLLRVELVVDVTDSRSSTQLQFTIMPPNPIGLAKS